MPSLCPKCGMSVPPDAARCTHCDVVLPSEILSSGPTSMPGVGGRWEVLEALDSLGSQKVYRVKNRTTEDEFALRMLPLAMGSEEEAKERVQNLIQRGKALIGEPGILPVVGFEVEDRTPYFITEVFRGACLQERIKKEKALPADEARRIGLGVATALASAHKHSFFHGELRPTSVLLGADDEVRVTDFGVGKVVSEMSVKAMGAISSNPSRIPFYKSPELVKSDLPDAKSDLYALGCLLFEAMTGEKRFPDSYREALKDPKPGLPFSDPCSAFPKMDPAMREVLRKLLAPAASDRFEDAEKVAAALKGESFAKVVALATGVITPLPTGAPPGKSSVPPPPPPPPRPSAPPPTGRVAPAAKDPGAEPRKPMPVGGLAIAVIVVGLLGAAGWMVWKGNMFAGFRAPVEEPDQVPQAPPEAPPALPGLPPPPPLDLAGKTLPARLANRGGRIYSVVDGAELVIVPGGDFLMGSADGGENETPQVRRVLAPFLIDRHEVTVGQYRRFCFASGRKLPPQPAGSTDHHPVVVVSWPEANAFAHWAGRRLPTEAEWEKAARGTEGISFPWGAADEEARRNGSGAGDGFPSLSPAGSFPTGASPFGALDMGGNAWEWCADWYEPGYYLTGPARDPRGPASGAERVVRGGSYLLGEGALRTSFRNHLDPNATWEDIGFRCALEMK